MGIFDSLPGERNPTIRVNIIDPNGDYATEWTVGRDIPAEIAKQAIDGSTGELYAVTTYDAGRPATTVCLRERWAQIKAQMNAIDQKEAALIAQQRDRLSEIVYRGDNNAAESRTIGMRDIHSARGHEIRIHPWRRFFARYIDMFVLLFAGSFAVSFFRSAIDTALLNPVGLEIKLNQLESTLISIGFAILIETIIINSYGWTPGKWFFNIKVLADRDRRTPQFLNSLIRTLLVTVCGIGLYIPFAYLILSLVAFVNLRHTKTTWWDSTAKTHIVYGKFTRARTLVCIAVFSIVVLLNTVESGFDRYLESMPKTLSQGTSTISTPSNYVPPQPNANGPSLRTDQTPPISISYGETKESQPRKQKKHSIGCVYKPVMTDDEIAACR